MIFKVTPDKSVKVVTGILVFLFILSIAGLIGMFLSERIIILPVLVVFIFLGLGLAYAYRPLSYTVTTENLIINRMAGDVTIPRSSIKSVTVIHRNLIDGSIRTFGVGGLFGYYGKFSNSKLGNMKWYVRRMDHLVLLDTSAEKILLSPDDIDGFVTVLL